jgi:hypothetical protein
MDVSSTTGGWVNAFRGSVLDVAGAPEYYENALELLDEPGEWYLDIHDNKLYYMPRVWENMADVTVTLPTIDGEMITITGSDGKPVYSNGGTKDGMEPSVQTVIELLHDPQLVRKGSVLVWFEATVICILNAIWILYADELFRWGLSFRVRNANVTEPSDWEMARRYIGWTVLPILALGLFVIGLQ